MIKQTIKKYINDNKFNPSKKMGQNFLNNEAILKQMVFLSDVKEKESVIEIGPGLGSLTKYLAPLDINLTIIELDKRLFEYIKQNIVGKNAITYINNDFLKLKLEEVIDLNKEYHVIANLPYAISTLILGKISYYKNIKKINVLVQKEMADRIASKPKTKDYNAMTIFFQTLFNTRKLLIVKPENFNPRPKVDSCFIELTRKDIDIKNLDLKKYNSFLKLCFLNRRKKMSNNLKQSFSTNKIKQVYERMHFDDNVRAEEISVETFMVLYKEFYD